jgi:hypothetical protein
MAKRIRLTRFTAGDRALIVVFTVVFSMTPLFKAATLLIVGFLAVPHPTVLGTLVNFRRERCKRCLG